MLSRAQNTFHHNPRLRGPVSSIIYLRNKETQQTLQVIVSIQYDASFSANHIYQ